MHEGAKRLRAQQKPREEKTTFLPIESDFSFVAGVYSHSDIPKQLNLQFVGATTSLNVLVTRSLGIRHMIIWAAAGAQLQAAVHGTQQPMHTQLCYYAMNAAANNRVYKGFQAVGVSSCPYIIYAILPRM